VADRIRVQRPGIQGDHLSWTEPASAAAFRRLFSSESIKPIGRILDDACKEMKCSLNPGRSFLGAGGTGFVFRVSFCRGDPLAIKVAARYQGVLSLQQEKALLEAAPAECVIKPSCLMVHRCSDVTAPPEGAAMVLALVGEVASPKSWADGLTVLAKLHSHGCIHGDPRRANLLHVPRLGYRWCDMVDGVNMAEPHSMHTNMLKLLVRPCL